jgi:hypothetical protein
VSKKKNALQPIVYNHSPSIEEHNAFFSPTIKKRKVGDSSVEMAEEIASNPVRTGRGRPKGKK